MVGIEAKQRGFGCRFCNNVFWRKSVQRQGNSVSNTLLTGTTFKLTHKINDLLVNVKGDTLAGGCFGNVTKDLYVKDLKLEEKGVHVTTSGEQQLFHIGEYGQDETDETEETEETK